MLCTDSHFGGAGGYDHGYQNGYESGYSGYQDWHGRGKCETISWPAINCWFGSRYDWAKTRDLVWHDEHWCIEPGARITYSRIWVATMMPNVQQNMGLAGALEADMEYLCRIFVYMNLYALQSILELLDALSSFSTHWLYGNCLSERWRWSSGLCWCCWKSRRGSTVFGYIVLTFRGFTIQWTTVCKIALQQSKESSVVLWRNRNLMMYHVYVSSREHAPKNPTVPALFIAYTSREYQMIKTC